MEMRHYVIAVWFLKKIKFSFLRAMLRSDSWSEINRSKQIILFQMDYGCNLEVKHI